MKQFIVAVIFISLFSFVAYAASNAIIIEPLPTISNISSNLKKSLDALKASIDSDAQNCTATARGMNSIGEYHSFIEKIVETKKMVALRVSGFMICDGVHSSTYQYGIAYEKISGKRLDLNKIYNIATRLDGHLFVRPELIDSVKINYRKVNKNNPSCLSTGWEEDIANLPITFLPLPDRSLALYFAGPDVTAACFAALQLKTNSFAKFRDAHQAARFELK